MSAKNPIFFVDVDDTLVRSVGSKRIPMPRVIAHVRELHEAGFELFCWSTGGAAYARESAQELGIEDCFVAFLPKPDVLIDDQEPSDWRAMRWVNAHQAGAASVEDYSNP